MSTINRKNDQNLLLNILRTYTTRFILIIDFITVKISYFSNLLTYSSRAIENRTIMFLEDYQFR